MKNSNTLKSYLFVFLASLLSVVTVLTMQQDVFADATTDRIDKIVLQHQAKTCYNSGAMNNSIYSFNSINDAFKRNKGSIVLLNDQGAGGYYDCRASFGMLNQLTGKRPSATNLGYIVTEEDSKELIEQCASIVYRVDNTVYSTQQLCFATRNDIIDFNEIPYTSDKSSHPYGGMQMAMTTQGTVQIAFDAILGTGQKQRIEHNVYYNGSMTWDTFMNNLATVAKDLENYSISHGNISGNIRDAQAKTSSGDASRYTTFEIKDNDYSAASQTMEKFYYGMTSDSSDAPVLTESDRIYVLNTSYNLALKSGHIVERTSCSNSKEEALKESEYAHFNSSTNKWCPVEIKSYDNNEYDTSDYRYALVAADYKSLGMYGIEQVLKLQTKLNLGSSTIESACQEQAEKRRQELIAARDAEGRTNGINTDNYAYLQFSINLINDLIAKGELVNNGVCVDLPSVDKNNNLMKTECANTFGRAITQLQKIIDSPDSTENEKAMAQDKLDKIKALNRTFWTEKEDGTIVCLKLEDVYNGITPGETPPGPTDPDDPNAGDANKVALCYSGGGPLGWIMCPVLELLGDATGVIYDTLIEPALEVKASAIFDRDTGVYFGWSAFRNFANIIFAILFLIVIFSQVTGFGLDNYGIKKVLPRLIMVAVLVNISFILCQLAVDVSNLLGVGLKDLFSKNLPIGVDELFSGYNGGTVLGGIVASVLTTIGIGAGTAKLVVLSLPVIGQSILWLLVILIITLIGCLISVLFFFVMLGVRQAGIIILIVLAPIAIVCYALPNTKGFFDKWKKLFQALLLVYPICGLLMGGGAYAGSLLLGIGASENDYGWFFTITAMLVTAVPFFFVPTILKSSMLAMGNLGMKMSNLGKRWGGMLGGAVRSSQGYQELLKDRQISLNKARVDALDKRTDPNRLSNKIRSRVPFFKAKTSLSRREQMMRNRYMASNDRLMLERAAAEANAQRKPMTYESDLYKANVDRARSRNVAEAAAAQKASWENSGVDSDFDALEDIAYESAVALRDNYDDDAARAKFLAAQEILESSDPGRERLKSALNHFDQVSVGKEIAANRAARWIANAGMNRNGAMLKRDSPTLAAQYGRYLDSGILPPGDITTDANGRYINNRDLVKRINDFNPEQISGFDDNDLKRLLAGMQDGTLNDDQVDKLIGLTQKAFSNPNTAAKIKGKAGELMHQMSSIGFSSSYWGSRQNRPSPHNYINAGAAMAKASESDLAYLETRLQDTSGSVPPAEKEDILKVMRSALIGAVNDNDYLGMTAENAQRMDKMLKKYGGQNGGITLGGFTGTQRKAYDRLLSKELRIKHGNQP